MKTLLKIVSFILFCNVFATKATALDILYPQQKHHKTTSDVTYIMGNVSPSSSLTINNEQVKVWKNGAFCKTVKLNSGHNVFKIIENTGSKTHSTEYTVNRIIPVKSSSNQNTQWKPQIEYFENLQYAIVTTDGAPVRESYSTDSERITHLPENTIIFVEGKYKDWYKISTDEENLRYWIHSKNIKILYPLNNHPVAFVRNVDFAKDKTFSEIKITLDYPVMFKTQEKSNNIYITLFGIKNTYLLENEISKQKIFSGLKIINNENNNITMIIPSNQNLWGYQASYNGNVFVFQKKNTPSFNKAYPLKNITIAIDPGHGGKELGTVGPTRIPEKDVNLAISKELKSCLEKEGAKVVMTRDDDSYLDLYKRPDIANENNALICLSIHSNSLVDKDPYEKHGVSVFYYHPQAKELAHQIKLQMIKDLKLKDDWHRRASFVLTRPTMPVSVLVEVAYMPHPEEYLMLTDPAFQKRAAKSICEGLKNYIRSTISE